MIGNILWSLSVCHSAAGRDSFLRTIGAHFNKNAPQIAFFCQKICSFKKKAVLLHPLLKNKHPASPSGRKPAERLRTEKRSMTRSVIQAWNAQSRECQCKLLNGVMVALQILVLSVWVRVLVEQQKKVSSWGLSCCSYRLKPRFSAASLCRLLPRQFSYPLSILESWFLATRARLFEQHRRDLMGLFLI